mgnify:CR=1 FL=1
MLFKFALKLLKLPFLHLSNVPLEWHHNKCSCYKVATCWNVCWWSYMKIYKLAMIYQNGTCKKMAVVENIGCKILLDFQNNQM